MAQTPPEPSPGSTPGTPRWVKAFGIIALVLVLLVAISLLASIRHGPAMHTPSGDAGGSIWHASVAEIAGQPSWS